MTTRMIGARIPRNEDPRLLRGMGCFVDDVSPKGLLHAACLGPAVIAEAVDDALAPLGVRIREMPLDPERLRRLIEDATTPVAKT
jgi:CO/xanthine dehydrogenase Mo-binding subunit